VLLSVSFVVFNVTQVSITLRIVSFTARLIRISLNFSTHQKFFDLFLNNSDIDEITKNAATTMLFATTTFRMINFYWNRMRFVNIVKAFDEGLRSLVESADESTKRVIDGSIRYMRNLTAAFWISALITANMMCINSTVQWFYFKQDSGAYPPTILRSWFPFDYIRNFWVIYGVQYYIMDVGMLIVPCWHAFIVSMMVFVIVELKILNQKLSKVDNEAQLVECIEKREKLFKSVGELSSLNSSSVFLDFLVFSVLLCTLLFQATQVNAGNGR
jgi:gustatory receptor